MRTSDQIGQWVYCLYWDDRRGEKNTNAWSFGVEKNPYGFLEFTFYKWVFWIRSAG